MKCFASMAAMLALGACSSAGKAPEAPPIASNMPAAWAERALPGAVVDTAATAPDWWRSFSSEELSALIAAALSDNPDLVIAVERVRQAEAQARIAGASLFPELNFGAGTSRRETRPDGGDWSRNDGSSAALSASYELDLWGRNAAGVRAAESSLRATRYDLETVRLTLVTGVATAYFQVLSLRGRLAVLRGNLAIAERVLKVVDARVRNGVASALDLSRQLAGVLSLRASIPPLELQERQNLYALAILVGRPPEGFEAAGTSVTTLAVPHAALTQDYSKLAIREFSLAFGGLEVEGGVSGDLGEQMDLGGSIATNTFDPRALLIAVGIAAPKTTDPAAFTRLQLNTSWKLAGGAIAIDPLKLTLDDTHFSGHFHRGAGEDPLGEFALRGDTLNISRYVPPTDPDSEPFVLPTAMLKALKFRGVFELEQATLDDVVMKGVTVRLLLDEQGLRSPKPAAAANR